MRAVVCFAIVLAGCDSGGVRGGGVGVGGGGAVDGGGDLALPAACAAGDDGSDGQPCGTGCAAGTVAVELGGVCRCYRRCTADVECSCDRLCDGLSAGDGGAAGSACLPGNGAGERCGVDAASGAYFGNGICAQGLACIDVDATHRYCAYLCGGAAGCPAQTMCAGLSTGGMACAWAAGTGGLGAACASGGAGCAAGLLCDGVCRTRCDGSGAACASGACVAVVDAAGGGGIVGYACE